MRTPMKLATLVLVAGTAACAPGRKADTAGTDDFQRDLQLAAATNMDVATPPVSAALLTTLETVPRATPEPAPTIKKAPEGDHAVHAEAPTVEATPVPEVAAVEETTPVVETVAPAPVPEPITEPVAVAPRPQPVALPAGGVGSGDYGGGGGVLGGGIGVVIRGGGVHGDRCEIHTRRGGVYRGPIFVPRPGAPTTGGTSVIPRGVSPRGRPTVVITGGR